MADAHFGVRVESDHLKRLAAARPIAAIAALIWNAVDADATRVDVEVDGDYPYKTEPQSTVEEVERQVFDIVALKVNKHLPEFAEQATGRSPSSCGCLRQAIERGPDALQLILTEVLRMYP